MENFYQLDNQGIKIRIRAVSNSSKNEICGIVESALKVKIKSPAVDNKANEELIKFFSKLLKIPKSAIILKSGSTAKIKTLYIDNCAIDKIEDFCVNISSDIKI